MISTDLRLQVGKLRRALKQDATVSRADEAVTGPAVIVVAPSSCDARTDRRLRVGPASSALVASLRILVFSDWHGRHVVWALSVVLMRKLHPCALRSGHASSTCPLDLLDGP